MTDSEPKVLEIGKLQSISDFGFTGGRDSFQRFCATIFNPGQPRFLRTDDDNLVVFRHSDLRALGATPQVANVPPGIIFPGLTVETAAGEMPADEGRPLGLAVAGVVSNQFFTMNPPIHGPVRKILVSELGPKQVGAMEPLARDIVNDLIRELPEDAPFDFVETFGEKLSARFFGTLLGMTDREKSAIQSSVQDMTSLVSMDRTPDEFQRLDNGSAKYRRLIETAVLRSLAEGGHPILERMAANLAALSFDDNVANVGIVPRNIGSYMTGNLFDAFHTAAVGAANTLYVLLRHPDILAQLSASPELLSRAIFEALRLEPPVIFLKRYVIEDFVYDGMIVPKGSLIAMLWAAGNHDPSVFPNPGSFDLTRSHVGITTFGGGIHICPGRYAAVMLAKVMLQGLKASGVLLELTESTYDWYEGHMMSQLKTMSVRITK